MLRVTVRIRPQPLDNFCLFTFFSTQDKKENREEEEYIRIR